MTSDSIHISVITPTYNRSHTLHRVFNSLKQQTLQNFEWIIIDDGSTDNTKVVVDEFTKEEKFPIVYYQQKNKHKFLSIFKGIDLAKGKYIAFVDSDDKILPNAFDTFYREIIKLPENNKYYGVIGLCTYEDGNIAGDKFPISPLDTSIFDMRYKYKVKGDKWGLSIKKAYQEINFDISAYENKGFIPETVLLYLFDKEGYKTRYINVASLIYVSDAEDNKSLANNFYSSKNSFGLCENYKTFITCYRNRFLNYPLVYFKNFIAYILFGIKNHRSLNDLLKIDGILIKIFIIFFYPLVYLFKDKTIRG
ncbi:glycosyltransferase family 2 protein [Apibacter muscae]|uniref:Glycosyltransferase family 2 protein n=1 Tax=Apibacter muscae TaxID=2509004 RepID=A0A563DGF8_9FLAO|nr:glycosyltransferase family 2 protein [Apibacter muscae]TWP29285.1 glycosyltransferase family 2 protein [Apibacter muscae]TWP31099.1 glycosyltransferase family 2 protein [Apibacter muscae]